MIMNTRSYCFVLLVNSMCVLLALQEGCTSPVGRQESEERSPDRDRPARIAADRSDGGVFVIRPPSQRGERLVVRMPWREGPALVEARATLDRPVTPNSLKKLIHDLDAWPDTWNEWNGGGDLSPTAWLLYLETAAFFQRQEPDLVASAVNDYIVHYDTAWDPEFGSRINEWSKVFILLRVMFDLPKVTEYEHDGKTYRGSSCFGGWMQMCRSGFEAEAQAIGAPVVWTEEGPTLSGVQSGYNGPPYLAGEEFWAFHAKFPYRKDLGRHILKLRQSLTEEVGNNDELAPAAPESAQEVDPPAVRSGDRAEGKDGEQ